LHPDRQGNKPGIRHKDMKSAGTLQVAPIINDIIGAGYIIIRRCIANRQTIYIIDNARREAVKAHDNKRDNTMKTMQVRSSLRRSMATLLMTAGLAYPACAAVCPKGIGGCPSPGRCFLFTDADANRFCDYTSRTGSPASGTISSPTGAPAPAQTAVPVTAVPTPDPTAIPVTAVPAPASPVVSSITAPSPVPDTTAAVLQQASSGGLSDTIHLSVPLLAGVLIFLILTGILFVLARRGLCGIPSLQTRPALALAALFSLGISLVITCVLAGGAVAGTTFALIYMGAGTLLAAYLWYAGIMNRRIVLGAAAMSTLAGFVFLAPIMPLELGGIVNVVTGTSTLTTGVMVICGVIAVTLIVGRTFCGSICPVGSLQELAYAVPVRKITVRHKEVPEGVRFAIFVVTIIAALSLIDLMAFTGLYELFSLTLSASLLVAAGIVLLSVFLYRPVCRILCPFGVLFSLCAEFSLYRLRRTEACISCKKCEKICPTMTAGKDDSKRECYLCGRCTDACPKKTALVYSR